MRPASRLILSALALIGAVSVLASVSVAGASDTTSSATRRVERLFVNFGGSVDGLAFARSSRNRRRISVEVSLHGLKPNQAYGFKASRHRCHGATASHFEGWTDGIIWQVVARTQPNADDLYTRVQGKVAKPKQLRRTRALYVYELAGDGTATAVSCGFSSAITFTDG